MIPSAPCLWRCAPPLRFGARSLVGLEEPLEDVGGVRQRGPLLVAQRSQPGGEVSVFFGPAALEEPLAEGRDAHASDSAIALVGLALDQVELFQPSDNPRHRRR